MLIKEKVEQAKTILKEMDVDCWITFARESIINGDPMLDFLVGSPITWHSAFIITKEGKPGPLSANMIVLQWKAWVSMIRSSTLLRASSRICRM